MSFSVDDFVREAAAQSGRDQEQLSRFAALADDNRQKVAELKAGLQSALQEFGAALLPQIDQISAATLADTLGMQEISRLWQQSDQRGQQLDRLLQELEDSQAWTTRQSRELTAAQVLDETTPLFNHARHEWETLSQLPRIHELVERGWGTPRYPHRSLFRYFNRDYLQDWKAADEAVEKLQATDFAQVTAQYQERQEQVQVLGRTMEDQQQILRDIQELETRRNSYVQERAALPQSLQSDVAARVSELIQRSPDLADRLPESPTVRARVQAIDGRQAQVRYLDGLQLEIERDRAEISERAERLREESIRYENNLYKYRNKSFSPEQFQKKFGREGRFNKRYDRYSRTSGTVYSFRNYDRVDTYHYYDPASDFLWWDVMTDGRLDGNFIPEVAEYREMHPDYQFQRTPQPRGNDYGNDDNGNTFDNSDFDLS